MNNGLVCISQDTWNRVFDTAWAKLAQQWFVCAPLGIHFEPINKDLCLVTGAHERKPEGRSVQLPRN